MANCFPSGNAKQNVSSQEAPEDDLQRQAYLYHNRQQKSLKTLNTLGTAHRVKILSQSNVTRNQIATLTNEGVRKLFMGPEPACGIS